MKKLFANYINASPALALNKDGSISTVSVFLPSEEKSYVFDYPFKPKDYGHVVHTKYISYNSFFGNLYVWLAVKAIKFFPKHITI